MVVAARPGSPAEKAGLRPGDILKSIDDRHTRPMPAVVADRLLRGAPGSSVKLGVLRAGADPFDVTVVRERVLPGARLRPDARGRDGLRPGRRLRRRASRTTCAARWRRSSGRARARLRARPAERRLGRPRRRRRRWPRSSCRAARWRSASAVARTSSCCRPTPPATPWSGPLVALVGNGTAGPGRDRGRGPRRRRAARSSSASAPSAARPSRRPCRCPRAASSLTVAKYMSPKGTAIHGEGLTPSVPVAAERDEDEDLPEGTPRPGPRSSTRALEVLKARGVAPTKAAA